MAVVTFGGAYAVLAYVAQEAVGHYRWLAPGEMLDGLGIAETTPGPLILVVEFVGFLAAFAQPGRRCRRWLAGVLGARWSPGSPSCRRFLWIFLGAPYAERLRGNAALAGALAAIAAAVVGVILNLAVWFALHVLFARVAPVELFGMSFSLPDPRSLDPVALALMLGAVVAVFRFNLGLFWLLGAWSLLGLACFALGA